MAADMEQEDQDDVRYYDQNGVEHRLGGESRHLIESGCRQSPIIKGILAVSTAIVILGVALLIGSVLGYVAMQLRNAF